MFQLLTDKGQAYLYGCLCGNVLVMIHIEVAEIAQVVRVILCFRLLWERTFSYPSRFFLLHCHTLMRNDMLIHRPYNRYIVHTAYRYIH